MSDIAAKIMQGGGEPDAGNGAREIAAHFRCEPALIAAFVAAESNGRGFDAQGRVRVLFEKHRFYRNLPGSKRRAAVRAGLARKKWISPAKGGYKDQPNNRAALDLLIRAIEIDETAALMSASYGLGQVLGENYALCGWRSVQAFVLDMTKSEAQHIKAMVGFLAGSGLQDELRAGDIDALVRVYNGPGQVDAYGGKIRVLVAKFKNGKRPAVSGGREGTLRIGSHGEDVEELQRALSMLGYTLSVDGDFGPATRRAVVAFQTDNGLSRDGIVGPKTSDALDAAKPVAEKRRKATAEDLREKGSRIVKGADHAQAVSILGVGLAALKGLDVAGVLDTIKEAKGLIGPATDFVRLLADNWWLAAGLGAAVLFQIARNVRAARVEDHRNGKTA